MTMNDNKKVEAMYVHIPFCKSICSYCDFTKIIYSFSYEEKYLDSLFYEIETEKVNLCKTIYIGGGTPSVLSLKGLEKLLSFLQKYLKEDYEFTIEVNPETIDEDKIKIFKKYGINRVSIGVESFNEDILTFLKRKHNYQDVKKCVELLNKYEIDNYSFDFIYGISTMNLAHLKKDFICIDELKPKHLSFYSLILEEHTCLKANNYKEADEDSVIEQYDYIYKQLKKRGYNQYEVSNYSLKGYESKHNLVYWKNKEYYGFGLGASGYVNRKRYINTKNMTRYLNRDYSREYEDISIDDYREEFIMLGLRLNEGINLDEYENLFKHNLLEVKRKEIEELVSNKLIKISKNKLLTTYQGMLLLDVVILKLI